MIYIALICTKKCDNVYYSNYTNKFYYPLICLYYYIFKTNV